ncbi:MAG TPA: hypothetical protein VK654_07335 [Nitrospirota bacterium]|nr:hypothetical protein [Nitrospirota bacterium]
MKIVAYIFIALFVVALGAAGFFYLKIYQPLEAENRTMKAGMPELDRAKAELRRIKDKESKESAWVKPAVDALSAGLSEEISAGKAEVMNAGHAVIVNITEDALYLPASYTFAKDSTPLRAKLVGLLLRSELLGKEIVIGNTTEGIQAQIRGRNKVPAKDARTLAAERSGVLIKDFEKNGVPSDMLVAAAYSAKQPEIGAKLKSHKTVFIISTPLAAPQPAAPARPATAATATTAAAPAQSAATTSAPQPRAIPVRPAQPQPK